MTSRDADRDTESAAADEQAVDGDSGAELETGDAARPDPATEFLSELARAPDEELDDLLADVVSGEGRTAGGDGTAEDVETAVDPSEVRVEEELLERLDGTGTRGLARTVAVLRAEIDRLDAELEAEKQRADDLESRLARKQADFQNYKKRQKERLAEEKERATEDFVTRLLDVRDNLERALEQDEDADIRSGVESTLDQFDQQLERENVERIEPEVGGETDPRRHEVLATIESDQPEDTVAQVHRPGYVMGEKVLRPAQVAVSDGSLAGEGE